MKKIFTLGLILGFSRVSRAQTCDGYWIMHDSSRAVFGEYDHTGRPVGKDIFLVSQVRGNGHSDSVRVLKEGFNRRGILVVTEEGYVQCRRGILWLDIRLIPIAMFLEKIKNVQVRAEPAVLLYPAIMQVGDSLDDGFTHFTVFWHGKALSTLDLAVTDRRVEGWDTLRLPIKTVIALRISYKVRARTTLMGLGIPVLFRYTEWFAPGFGLVKDESVSRKGRVNRFEMLVSMRNYP